MSKYSSQPVVVKRSAETIAEQFADFRRLQSALDNLPADEKAKVGDVSFTEDTIKISTQQVGEIKFKVDRRTPEAISLKAEKSPVPMNLILEMKPVDAESTELTGVIDVDIPMMLRPIVGPTLQKAADQFGSLFARFVYVFFQFGWGYRGCRRSAFLHRLRPSRQ